jgi:hypothetical protein
MSALPNFSQGTGKVVFYQPFASMLQHILAKAYLKLAT